MNHNVAQPPFNVGSNVCGCLYSIREGSHVKDDLPGWFSVLQEIYGAEEYLNHRQHTSQHGAGTHRKPVKCKTSLGGNIRHMVVTRNQHTRNNRRGMRDQKSCQANHLRSPEMENPTEWGNGLEIGSAARRVWLSGAPQRRKGALNKVLDKYPSKSCFLRVAKQLSGCKWAI